MKTGTDLYYCVRKARHKYTGTLRNQELVHCMPFTASLTLFSPARYTMLPVSTYGPIWVGLAAYLQMIIAKPLFIAVPKINPVEHLRK